MHIFVNLRVYENKEKHLIITRENNIEGMDTRVIVNESAKD
jgi:hypothetical protein